ncbi:MAG TPA: winged helix-turn-helix transcriptional regulator [Pseudosphingobacterium sp.]|nr:winged helix-turn-helix transcriptional regulator [Pseudosphingobacterium sp.]
MEYFLTDFGESLVPVIKVIDQWGAELLQSQSVEAL